MTSTVSPDGIDHNRIDRNRDVEADLWLSNPEAARAAGFSPLGGTYAPSDPYPSMTGGAANQNNGWNIGGIEAVNPNSPEGKLWGRSGKEEELAGIKSPIEAGGAPTDKPDAGSNPGYNLFYLKYVLGLTPESQVGKSFESGQFQIAEESFFGLTFGHRIKGANGAEIFVSPNGNITLDRGPVDDKTAQMVVEMVQMQFDAGILDQKKPVPLTGWNKQKKLALYIAFAVEDIATSGFNLERELGKEWARNVKDLIEEKKEQRNSTSQSQTHGNYLPEDVGVDLLQQKLFGDKIGLDAEVFAQSSDKSGFISLDSNDQIMITKEDWDGMYDKALVRIDEEVSRKAAAGAWNEDQTNAEKERLINNMRSPAEFQDDVREAITQLAISGTMKRKEGISNVDDYNLHGLNEYFASAGDIMSARQRIEQDMRDIGIIFDANINQYTWQSDSRMYQEGHKEKLDGLKKMHSMLVQGQHIEKIVCDQINQGDSLREGFNLLNREVEVDDVVIQKLSESVARLQHLVEQEGASNEQKEQLEIGLKFVNSLALEKAEAENEGGKLHVSRFTLAQVCAGDLGKGRVLNANPNAAMHVDDQLFVPDFKSATDIMQMRNAQKLETLLTSKVATLKQEIERGNYSLGVIAEQEIHAPEQQRKIEETLQLKGQELAIIEKGFNMLKMMRLGLVEHVPAGISPEKQAEHLRNGGQLDAQTALAGEKNQPFEAHRLSLADATNEQLTILREKPEEFRADNFLTAIKREAENLIKDEKFASMVQAQIQATRQPGMSKDNMPFIAAIFSELQEIAAWQQQPQAKQTAASSPSNRTQQRM